MGTKNYNNALDLVSFSRASGGTALRKISYGSELVTNGTFDTDTTGWTAVRSSTLSSPSNNLRVTNAGGVTAGAAEQVVSTEVGKVYQISADFTYGGATSGAIRIGTTSQGFQIANVSPYTANQTITYSFVATTTTAYIGLFNNAGTDGDYNEWDNVSVKEVLFDQPDGTLTLFNHPDDIPRIEYDTSGNPKGILIEEARTNLQIYSEDFSDVSWYTPTAFLTTDAAVSPDGRTNAAKLGGTSGSTNMRLQQSVSLSAGTTYTYSIFAKAGEFTTLRTQRVDTNLDSWGTVFDLSSGTVTSGVGNMEDFGNGWYRCSGEAVCNTSATTGVLYVCEPGGTGDGTSGIYVYGAQLEEGAFPTSYIGTSGATATRSADIASIAVDQFGYNQKAGTVVVEFDSNGSDGSSFPRMYQLKTSSTDAKLALSTSNVLYVDLFGNPGFVSMGVKPTNTSISVASAFREGDLATSDDGDTVVTGSPPTIPSVSSIIIGSSVTSNYLNGHIKSLKYYPRRLSNAQLQELTS